MLKQITSKLFMFLWSLCFQRRWWLELPSLSHPQHIWSSASAQVLKWSSLYSLPDLSRLPDVSHGLSESATTCDSILLSRCVCYLASLVSPRPLQWSIYFLVPAPRPLSLQHLCYLPTLQCGSVVLDSPRPPAQLLPEPLWVSATTPAEPPAVPPAWAFLTAFYYSI